MRIVTPHDTEVIIPHSLLWSASISNTTNRGETFDVSLTSSDNLLI